MQRNLDGNENWKGDVSLNHSSCTGSKLDICLKSTVVFIIIAHTKLHYPKQSEVFIHKIIFQGNYRNETVKKLSRENWIL